MKMKKLRWLGGVLAALMVVTSVPVGGLTGQETVEAADAKWYESATAASTEITTWEGLKNAVTAAGTTATKLTLGSDITVNEYFDGLIVPETAQIYLDLNGHDITVASTATIDGVTEKDESGSKTLTFSDNFSVKENLVQMALFGVYGKFAIGDSQNTDNSKGVKIEAAYPRVDAKEKEGDDGKYIYDKKNNGYPHRYILTEMIFVASGEKADMTVINGNYETKMGLLLSANAKASVTIENGNFKYAGATVDGKTGRPTVSGSTVSKVNEKTIADSYDGASFFATNDVGTRFTFEAGNADITNCDLDCGIYAFLSSGGGDVVLGDKTTNKGPEMKSFWTLFGENNLYQPANFTVYGGEFVCENHYTASFNTLFYLAGDGSVNIYGGTFKQAQVSSGKTQPTQFDNKGNIFSFPYSATTGTYNMKDMQVNVYGGNFTIDSSYSNPSLIHEVKDVKVNSETKTANYIKDATNAETKNQVNVYGGTFNFDVNSKITDVTDNTNGMPVNLYVTGSKVDVTDASTEGAVTLTDGGTNVTMTEKKGTLTIGATIKAEAAAVSGKEKATLTYEYTRVYAESGEEKSETIKKDVPENGEFTLPVGTTSVEVAATYKDKTYPVKYISNDKTHLEENVPYSGKYTLASAALKDGSVFVGWVTEVSSQRYILPAGTELDLTAGKATVSAKKYDGGAATGEAESKELDFTGDVTFTAAFTTKEDETEIADDADIAAVNSDEKTLTGETEVKDVEVESNDKIAVMEGKSADETAEILTATAASTEVAEAGAEVISASSEVTEPTDAEAIAALEQAGLVTVSEDADGNTVIKSTSEGGAEITDNGITIVKEVSMAIEVTGYSEENGEKELVLDIQPVVQVKVVLGSVNSATDVKNDNSVNIGEPKKVNTVSGSVTISVTLPDGFTSESTLYVKHKKGGKNYFYKGSVASKKLTFTNPHGFSEFTISGTSAAKAEIGDVGYETLQDAVNAVSDNGTIAVLTTDQSATVSRAIKFTLTGTGAASATITAGTNYNLSKSGDTYTITAKSTTPSGGTPSGGSGSTTTKENDLVSIAKPDAVNVANGTTLADIVKKLPATVKLTVGAQNNQTTTVDGTVKWNETPTPAYDATKTDAQTLTFTGEVTLPTNITNTKKVSTTVTVTVNVAKKGEDVTPTDPTNPSDETTTPAKGEAVQTTDATGAKAGVYTVTNAEKKTVSFDGTTATGTKVTIPATVTGADGTVYTVTSIKANALKGNTKIKTVVIGKNITKIGKNAFLNCKKLKTIKINANKLKSVGKNAFKNTAKTTKVTVLAKNKKVYKKAVTLLKKAGLKKAKFTYKKAKA